MARSALAVLLLSLLLLDPTSAVAPATKRGFLTPVAKAAAKAKAAKPKVKCVEVPRAKGKGKGTVVKCVREKPSHPPPPPPPPVALYVFGDSLSDVGNNNRFPTQIKVNFLPYGIDYIPASGRFSNGRVVPDYLATYLRLPPVPPFLARERHSKQGVSFASGGAAVLSAPLATALNFTTQVRMFEQYMKVRKMNQKSLYNSIFYINFGASDCINTYLLSLGVVDLQNARVLQIKNYIRQLTLLRVLGARKFVIANVGPIGCTPTLAPGLAIIQACNFQANSFAENFNEMLDEAIGQLRRTPLFQKATIVTFDTYQYSLMLRSYPDIAGLSKVSGPCCMPEACGSFLKARDPNVILTATVCPDRNSYFFWDDYHPTEAVNKAMSKMLWSGDQYVVPFNLSTLVLMR